MWVKVYMDSFTSSHVVGWWKFPPNQFGGKLFPILFTYEAWTRLGGCHTGVWRGCLPVGAASELFFFFFPQIRFDLARFTPTWLLFSPIHAELGQFGQNQAVSAESGRIGQPYWPAIEMADIGWNRLWMRPKHPKSVLPQFYSEYLLLLLCFVLCFLPSSFFVLWIKA